MRTHDDGFTLLELLVVMVIVGLLAAIAIPSFLTQRGRAYEAAMKADLHALVVSETSWVVDNDSFTADLAALHGEGFRETNGVTAHVKLVGTDFVACTRHLAASEWMVYDSATSSVTRSGADCV